MQIKGPLPPELAAQLGKCEVCGEQATHGVQDYYDIRDLARRKDDVISPAGFHRFCDEHARDPKDIVLTDDSSLYCR